MKAILPPKDSVQGRGGQIIVLTLTRLLLPCPATEAISQLEPASVYPSAINFSFILRLRCWPFV